MRRFSLSLSLSLQTVVLLKLAWLMLSGTATAQVRTTVLGQDDSLAAYIPYFFREAPPAIRLPEVDVDAARREDQRRQGRPPRFGLKSAVDLTQDDGRFYELDEATVAWKLRLRSPGATSLNFVLRDFSLPPGGQLYLYDRAEGMVMGPIVPEVIFEATYATDMIFGDEVILLALLPAERQQDFSLRVTEAVHGYRTDAVTRNFGASAACNVDVACPLGNNWGLEADAVARVLAGTSLASGALVNSACNSYRPFFLTAFHVLDDGDGILNSTERSAVSTWVFRFGYESPTCNGNEPTSWISYSGSQFRAGWAETDFLLLELNGSLIGQQDLALLGWDRSSSPPNGPLTFIHHPKGDVKKISVYNSSPSDSITAPFNATTAHVWNIPPGWDQGTSQTGSSGGPLLNSSGRIVGQQMAQSAVTDECLNDYDIFFGQFDNSWTGDTSDDGRLSNWLGGNGNPTATNTVRPPNFAPEGYQYLCTGSPITYTLSNLPPGLAVTWQATPASLFANSSGSGPSATLTPSSVSASGEGTITFRGPCNEIIVAKELWVGKPSGSAGTLNGPSTVAPDVFVFYTVSNTQPTGSNGFYWTFPLGWQIFSGGNAGNGYPHAWAKSPNSGGNGWVQARPANPCGYGSTSAKWVRVQTGGTGGPTLRQGRPMPGPEDGMALIYPNPSQGKLSIALQPQYTEEAVGLALLDLTGRVVLETEVLQAYHELDLAELPAGVYLLRLSSSQASQTLRFTLNR